MNVEAVSVIIETASLFSLSYTHYSLFANHRADFLYMQMEENKIKAGNVNQTFPVILTNQFSYPGVCFNAGLSVNTLSLIGHNRRVATAEVRFVT